MSRIPQRKKNIVKNLCDSFEEYQYVIVVALDNVSTTQIQKARKVLRSEKTPGKIIVGKNSLINKAIDWVTSKAKETDQFYEQRKDIVYKPELKILKDYIKMNVGLIFTNDSYQDLREIIESDTIAMPAKAGVLAPCDVILQPGPTPVDSGKIDYFHKLNIPVKVARGTLEITKPVHLIVKGTKVGEGPASMCRTLGLTPFEYKLTFKYVYINGQVIDEKIICMDNEEIIEKFKFGVTVLTALSLGLNFPNKLSAPHMLVNGFMKLLALGVTSGYEFKELAEAKTNQANAPAVVEDKKDEAVAVEEEKEESEADVSMGGLFSDDDSSD